MASRNVVPFQFQPATHRRRAKPVCRQWQRKSVQSFSQNHLVGRDGVSPSPTLLTMAKHSFALETANHRLVSPNRREWDFHGRKSISPHNFHRDANACPRNPAAIDQPQANEGNSTHVSKTKPIVATLRSSLAVHKTDGRGPASTNNHLPTKCWLIARFYGAPHEPWIAPAMFDGPWCKR
jgi:hypothetical protein